MKDLKENVNIWSMIILIFAVTVAAILVPMALIVHSGYNGATWNVEAAAVINIVVILISGIAYYLTRD